MAAQSRGRSLGIGIGSRPVLALALGLSGMLPVLTLSSPRHERNMISFRPDNKGSPIGQSDKQSVMVLS